MSAMVYGLAKVDEKKYRENYDRIFNKENKMNDELHIEKSTSHEIGIVMGGYLDENNRLMDRAELDRRIAMKDDIIADLKDQIKELEKRYGKCPLIEGECVKGCLQY